MYKIKYQSINNISIIGIFGNLLVIAVIVNTRELRRRRVDFFIVHQSFIDLLASILILVTTQLRGYKVIII